MLLALSGWTLGKFFNILQCPGQPPTTKNDLAENVSRPSVDVPCCRAPVPAS